MDKNKTGGGSEEGRGGEEGRVGGEMGCETGTSKAHKTRWLHVMPAAHALLPMLPLIVCLLLSPNAIGLCPFSFHA